MADVRLVDLEVIKKYSLAVRHDTVPAEEVLAALEASLEVVRAALGRTGAPPRAAAGASRTRGPARTTPARTTQAQSTQAQATQAQTTKAQTTQPKTVRTKSGQTGTGTAQTRRRSGRAGSE